MHPAFPTTGSRITAAIASGMRVKRRLHSRRIVIGQRVRQRGNLLRHSRRPRNAKCRHTRSCFHQQPIRMPVIAAFKLDNDLASRRRTSQPYRRHRRLGPRTHKAHLLNRRIAHDDSFRQIRFTRRRRSKARRISGRPLNRLHHRRKRMTQDHWSPGTYVIYVAIAVCIHHVSTLRALDKWRSSAYRAKRPHRRIHPAREKALCALLQCVRTCTCWG